MGLFDVLFLLLLVWWIFRAMGGGRAPKEEDRPGRPAPDRRPGSAGGRQEAESEWRRRLREAVQEWEVEQRRRSGEPVAEAEARPAGRTGAGPTGEPVPEAASRESGPSHAEARRPLEDARPEGGTRFREVRDVTADRPEGLGPEIGEATERPEHRRPAAERRRPIAARRPPTPGRPERVPSPRTGPGLPGFARRSDLQRAILYMEILGPPRAASDRPWHEYAP